MNINKIIKNEKLILFFILLLVIYLLNLDINTEKKLSLMIVGLLVCIYDTKMIIPYITGLLILLSLHFQKKKDNNIKNKKTIETFQQSLRNNIESTMNNFTENFSGDSFNPNESSLRFIIKNINLYKEYLRINPQDPNPNIDFLRDLYFIPFFIINTNLDGNRLKNLVNSQRTMNTLVNRLQFINTNDRNPQKEYINDLDNLFVRRDRETILNDMVLNLKIGILFTKYRNNKYSRYLNKVSLSLGLLGFINDNLLPELPNTNNISFEEEYSYLTQSETSTNQEDRIKLRQGAAIRNRFRNSEFEYRRQKKNIQEIIILLHKIKNNFTDNYDINRSIDSDNDTSERFSDLRNINEYDVNLFEIFDLDYINKSNNPDLNTKFKSLLDYNYKSNNPTFLLRGTGDNIYLKLTIDDLSIWDDNFK